MPTAVVASVGDGPLHVAICAEYDALPGVGHACGHNVICTAGLGAALALAPVADELGLKVTLLGTPAEEGGGGKIGFVDGGFFKDVHAAMMVHPYTKDVLEPNIIAVQQLAITYTGVEAHASGFPWRWHQCRRRHGRGPDRHRPAAPADPAGRPHPRHRHQGR